MLLNINLNGIIVYGVITIAFAICYIFTILSIFSIVNNNREAHKYCKIISIIFVIIYIIILYVNKEYILCNPYTIYFTI